MIRLLLEISVPYNWEAEDAIEYALTDEALLGDLIAAPVCQSLKGYLAKHYGNRLQVDIALEVVE